VQPPQSYIFPVDRGGATQSAVLPLLGGLLLVSIGLWLMSMRHRREALQAAALERTKTDFLNLASHELRGPLTILKGYVSTAREGHFGELPEAFVARIPTVQGQLGRMEMLVEQMLETARLDAGNPDVQRELNDLRRLVRGAVPSDGVDGPENRVDIHLPDVPVEVDVDSRRIEQVLRNLVDNALKYSDPPAHVSVRLWTDEEQAHVSVTDQGFGISPEDMKRLFSRFGRLVTDRNSHIPGVGLGLYLGRTVARMHGGELDATSEPGRGSTFTLTLPLHREDTPAGHVEEAPVQRAVRFFARLLPSRARGSIS
jgi:signal transduction histidine kinase